jgi:GTP cyclohydrolase I/GTP cyclohydrolase-4
VEDSVRHALSTTLERYPALDDHDFLHAQQVNIETIHRHDVLAERSSTAGELRRELAGEAAGTPTTLHDWLSS